MIDGFQKNVNSPFNSRNKVISDNNNTANNKFFSTGKNMMNSMKDNKSNLLLIFQINEWKFGK